MSEQREIELTFLLKYIPDFVYKVKPTRIVDIYIPEDSDFPPLRLRQKGHKYEMTRKLPARVGDYSNHIEQTIPLEKDEFQLLGSVSSRELEKDRYTVKWQEYVLEFDIFYGALKGLALVECEFKNKKEMKSFVQPEFCLADITQELFIAGGQLAGKSYLNIQEKLAKFRYEKIST